MPPAPAVPPVPRRSPPWWSTTTPGRCSRAACSSLLDDGAAAVVVVENGAPGSAEAALGSSPAQGPRRVCGSCARAPTSATGPGSTGAWPRSAAESSPEWVLVSNPDLEVHPGALPRCVRAARGEPRPGRWWGRGSSPTPARSTPRCGPSRRSPTPRGTPCSAVFKPDNPFTRRYNPGTPEGDVVTGAGWVSGSCFLARRRALEELGGFDEAYFMYARGHRPVLARPPRRVGRGLRRHGGGHARPGGEHGPRPLPHDGGAPPLRPPLHVPHHHGLAASGSSLRRARPRGAHGDGHPPHRASGA